MKFYTPVWCAALLLDSSTLHSYSKASGRKMAPSHCPLEYRLRPYRLWPHLKNSSETYRLVLVIREQTLPAAPVSPKGPGWAGGGGSGQACCMWWSLSAHCGGLLEPRRLVRHLALVWCHTYLHWFLCL